MYCYLQDAKGKVTIDFKDPQSLRVLTKCLLKADFNLDVEIPEDRLVPTLPLRLNYVLWIEDLTAAIGRDTDVRGIDIGIICSCLTKFSLNLIMKGIIIE